MGRVAAHGDDEAGALGAPGDRGGQQAHAEQPRRQQAAQPLVDRRQGAGPRSGHRQPRHPAEQPRRERLPGEDGDAGRDGGEAQRGPPRSAGKGERADRQHHRHPQEVGHPLGQHRRRHPQRRPAAELAHQPRLAQLAGLAGGHRQQEPDQEDRQAAAARQGRSQLPQVELPAGEAQRVVEQRERQDGRQKREVEASQLLGETAWIGQPEQTRQHQQAERQHRQQPPPEVVERLAGNRAAAGLRVMSVSPRGEPTVVAGAQAAASSSAASGYCSNRRIHLLVFL